MEQTHTPMTLAFTDQAAASFDAIVANPDKNPFFDVVNAIRLRQKMEAGSVEGLAGRSVEMPVPTAEYGAVRLIVRGSIVFAFTDQGADATGTHQILVVAVFALLDSQPTAALSN